jgi:hypothetical protein
MERDVKQVQIHYDEKAKYFSELCGETLRVTLASGKMFSIELFEREPGFIYIRTHDARLTVQPESSNSIRFSV